MNNKKGFNYTWFDLFDCSENRRGEKFFAPTAGDIICHQFFGKSVNLKIKKPCHFRQFMLYPN
jgi:hypothetical protein